MFPQLAFAIWTVEALMQLAAPSDPQIRPDGKAFAYVYKGEVRTAALPAATILKPPFRGTRPRWSPDGTRLAFLTSDQTGKTQVFVRDSVSAIARQITFAPASVSSFSWFPDGKAIAYIAVDTGKDPDPIVADTNYRFARIYWQPVTERRTRLLTRSDRHVLSLAISPDGKRIAYAAQTTPRNRDVFNVDICTVDVATGTERDLVRQPGRDGDPSWSPDGKLIAFHSQASSTNYFEARHVAVISAAGGPIRYISQGRNYDVFRNGNVFAWSPQSDRLVFTAGRGVHDILVEENLQTGQSSVLAEDISGAVSMSRDGQHAVYLKTSTEHPAELYALESGKHSRLTHLQDAIAGQPRMRGEAVRWKSKDGLEIEGVLWLPADYKSGRPLPMITELHGGPTGTSLLAFPLPRVYPVQMFVQSGIAVFSPNFRGSTNYGAAFRLKNALSQGIGDYQDVMTGIDHLVQAGIADPNRLGVMGWSYGGYLTGSVISQTNRFKAASVGAPATDWFTYYGQTDGSPDVLRTYFGASPWEVPENYARHSSRSRLKDIRTPSLLQVGAVDINHNGEIYKALIDHDVPVEYVVYPREGHGISEPAHVRDLLDRNYRWFTKWLAAPAATTAAARQ